MRRYVVAPSENHVSEWTAIFDDESQAEDYAAQLSHDPDFDGCEYAVQAVWITHIEMHAVDEDGNAY